MRSRRLGNSELDVTVVSLGSWLTFGGSVDETNSRACIERAYDLGVRFFDTANVYSGGAAETVLGEVLEQYPRESLVIATKVYFPVGPGPEDQGLSHRHILDQIDKSLHRLQISTVDLYQCHRYDTETPLTETCEVMNELIRAGKIRYWGISEWKASQIEECVSLCAQNGWAAPVSNQPQYSALYRRIEKDVIPVSERLGLAQVVWSPLAGGVLTGKYRNTTDLPEGSRATGKQRQFMGDKLRQPVLDAVQRLEPLAGRHGISVAQLSLAWCLRLPNIASVIVGASKVSQVEDNVAAADVDLDAATIDEMNRILEPVAQFD